MKRTLVFIFLVLTISVQLYSQKSSKVYYVELQEVFKINANPIKQIEPQSNQEGKLLRVYPQITFQTIEGVGGAFNEIGGEALMSLDEEQREVVMKNLFSDDGSGFAMCRTAIGASDFGVDAYSYSEVANDYQMENFSVDREKNSVIPYIKLALKYNPNMNLFASPWSPPGWMKESGMMDKGIDNPSKNRLTDEPEIYKAYALYFSKYIQAYKQQGIDVKRILIQNEQDFSEE